MVSSPLSFVRLLRSSGDSWLREGGFARDYGGEECKGECKGEDGGSHDPKLLHRSPADSRAPP